MGRTLKQYITTANSGFKKLADQWLNEAFCFVSSSVLVDSFVLRNPQLLKAAKRWAQCLGTSENWISPSYFVSLLREKDIVSDRHRNRQANEFH